jgi:hypothetical protein
MIGFLEKSEKRSIHMITTRPIIISNIACFLKNQSGNNGEFCIKIMKKNIFGYCIHKIKKIQF